MAHFQPKSATFNFNTNKCNTSKAMPRTYNTKQSGFTLIEVMVALTIIAISLGALISTSGSQASSATYLKQKTLAHWVALNELAQLNIDNAFPDPGEKKGSTSMANHDWYWLRKTTKLEESKDRREVVFTVYIDSSYKKNLTSLTGYVHAPSR
jgi:general secretion pathway protein I